jgi:hypothetical protein
MDAAILIQALKHATFIEDRWMAPRIILPKEIKIAMLRIEDCYLLAIHMDAREELWPGLQAKVSSRKERQANLPILKKMQAFLNHPLASMASTK